MKITKLTEEQKARKEFYRRKYTDFILDNHEEVDINFLKDYFAWFYKQFKINDMPPKVYLCDNPMDMYRTIAKVKGEKLKYYEPTSYLNKYWTSWISFYDFFNTECFTLKKAELFNKYKSLFDQNISYCVAFKGAVFVSRNAEKYLRNSRRQLHSVNEPAVQFRGYNIYRINGVRITKALFDRLSSKEYTFAEWAKESNEEVKSAVLSFFEEKFGSEYLFRFISDNLKEIETYTDKKDPVYLKGTTGGMNTGVYTLFKGTVNKIPIAFVRCYCPSTDRMFFLSVESKYNKASDAIASLYRVPKKLANDIKSISRQGERFSTIFTDAGKKKFHLMCPKEISNLVSIPGEQYFKKMTYEY